MLEEYWSWDDTEIESVHDFIQWMFPLDEPSAVNPDAPILTRDDKTLFRKDPLLQSSMSRSLLVFLNFLGLEMRYGQVVRGAQFTKRINIWQSPNHNWLRITRMLESLRLLGFEKEAREVWNCLCKIHDEGYVSENSFEYWSEAAEGLD